MKSFINVLFLILISFSSNIFGQCDKVKINLGPDTILCKDVSISLKAGMKNIPTGNAISFKWFYNNSLIPNNTDSTYNILSFTNSQSGIYKCEVSITGCSSKYSDEISIINVNNFKINSVSSEIIKCQGSDIKLETTLLNNSNLVPTYKWTGPLGYVNNTSSPIITNLQDINSGNYTVVSQIGQCKKDSTIIKVNVLSPSVTGDNVQDYNNEKWIVKCTNPGETFGNIYITNGITNNFFSTASDYKIDWGDNKDTTIIDDEWQSLKHRYNVGLYKLTIKINTNINCDVTKYYNVFVGNQPASPQIQLPQNAQGCSPMVLSFPISGYKNNIPGTTYTIAFSDGSEKLNFDQNTLPEIINHSFVKNSCGSNFTNGTITESNAFGVTIQAINPCGSSSSSAGPVRTSSPPITDLDIKPKACVDETVKITNTSEPGKIVQSSSCSTNNAFYWEITPNTGWTLMSNSKLGNYGQDEFDYQAWNKGSMELYVKFTQPGKYSIKLTEKNTCFDKSVKIKDICIQSTPTPSFSVTPKKGCTPLVSNFTNTSTNINQCDSVTRKWIVTKVKSNCDKDSTLDYRFISGSTETSLNPVIRFNNEGEYTVVLQLTNMCGVFKSSAETFIVGRKPKLSITTPSDICFGQTVKPSATSQDCGNTISGYNWTFANASPPSSNTLVAPTLSYSSSGTKTITLEATNSCGTTTETTNINVLNPPNVDAGLDQKICTGETVTIGSTAIPGLTYSWSPTTGLITSTKSNPTLTLTNNTNLPIINKYVLTASNAANCINKDSLLITVNPLPNLTVTTSTEICAKKSITLTVSGADSYNWSPNATLNMSTGSSVTATPTTTTTYTVVGTNNTTNCKNTATTTITINNLPIVNAGNDQNLCNQPIPILIQAVTSGGTWSGTNITSNGTYTPNGVGTTKAIYTIVDSKGCENKDTILVNVKNPEVVEAGNDIAECLNTANKTLNGTPTGGSWSGSTITSSNGTLSFNQVGTFKLYYTVGTESCKTKDSLQVTIKALPTVNAGTDQTKCINDSDFNLSGTPLGGTWSGTGIASNGLFSPNSAKSGIKTITYTYTDATTTCTNKDEVLITVNDITTVNAGLDTTVCNQPIPFKLIGTPTNGTWSGSGISSDGVYTPSAVGKFTITYTYKNASNCSNQDTREINIINPTDAEAGPNVSICIDTVSIQLNGNPTNGIWTGNNNISQNGVFKPQNAGEFKLYYNVGAGTCARKDSMMLTVKSLPVINANNDTSICINGGDITLKSLPTGGTWSGTGIIANSAVFSPIKAGKGEVKVIYQIKDPITSCKNKDEVKIIVNDTTHANAGIDTSVCNQPFQIRFFGKPSGGTWTGTNISSDGKFTPNGIGKFKVTYSYTNTFKCTTIDEKIIEVVDPTIAKAGNNTDICLDTTGIQLNGNPNNGQWVGNNITTSGFFKPTIAGDFKVYYNYGSGACATKDSLIVKVKPLPTLDVGINLASCINAAPINLTATPLKGYWLGNGVDSLGHFNSSSAGLGITKIKYNFRDPSTKCFNSKELQITIHDTTTLFVGSDTTLCNQPFPVQLKASPTGGNWSGTNITANGLYTPTTLGDFVVTYSYSNNFNCKNKIHKKISIITPIQSNAGKDDSICYDQKTKILIGLPPNGSWTGQNITSDGTFTRTHPGNYYNVYSYGAGNCLTRDTMKLIVHSLPIVQAGSDKSFCGSDHTYNFSGLPIGGKWKGPGITDEINGTFDPTKVIAGKHNLIYTYIDIKTGCSNEDTLIATVNPLPIVDFTIKPILCINVEEQIINKTQFHGSSSWDFGNQTVSSLENPKIIYSKIGSYKVKLIETSPFGCIDSITKFIQVWDPPKAIFSIDKDSLCSPAKVTITQNAYGSSLKYNWDFGNGKIDTIPSPPPITYLQGVIADTIYNLNLSVSNLCGLSSLTRKIKVMPIPKAMFHTNVSSGCTPLPIDFYNKTLGLPKQFIWDFENGTSTTKDSLFQRVFTTDSVIKTFNVKLIAINSCGSDTIIKSIIVKPNTINAFFNVDKNEGCNDLLIKFTENSIGQTFSSWDFGDGSKTTMSNPSHLYTKAGNYVAKLFITNGCSFDTASVKIKVLPSPVIDFTSSSDSLCLFGIFNFKSFTKDTVSLVWDFGDGTNSFYDNTEHMYLKSGSFLVELKATNMKNGCVTKKTENVFVHKKPIADFEMDTTKGCVPLTINFINKSIEGKFFAWDFDDGNSSNQKELKHTYTKSGNLNVQLIIESEYGCKDTLVKNINPFPIPTIDFNYAMTDPCFSPLLVSFTNNSSGANNYNWNFGNGIESNMTNPDTKFTVAGTYSVSLSGSNTYNCNITSKKNIIVNQKPDADFDLNVINGCVPLTVEITNKSKFSNFYNWNLGDGNSSNTKDPKHIFSKDGKYQISLITENSNGCKDTISKDIIVYPLPISKFSFTNSDPCFQPMKITTINESVGAVNYIWEFGNGITSNLTHPITDYSTVGNHMILLRAQNEYGCENITKQYIKNFNTPKLTPNLLPSGFCEHDHLFYSINSLFINNISWDMGNGKINNGASFNYAYPKQGNYTITVIGQGEGGCADTIELNQKIVVNPDPVADFQEDPIKYDELLNGSVEYHNHSTQADTYLWRFGDGDFSETIDPIHKFKNTGDYTTTLIAYNKYNCSDSITKKIHVDFFKGLYVPNAIYLGHQDFEVSHFLPKGVGLFEYEISIYDDWGNLIWRSTALDEYGRPTEAWDGTYKGEFVQQDSYVWKVNATFRDNSVWEGKEYSPNDHKPVGTVTVIK